MYVYLWGKNACIYPDYTVGEKKRCTRNAKFHILHFSNITIAILLDFDQTFTVHKVITLNIFALLFPLQNQYKQRDEAQY